MSRIVGEHVIVVGAGMGGLAAAKALSAHFDRVTVLERDLLPLDATPRQGTPQARHLHALLAGGLVALNELLPGFETELEQAGAIRLTPQSLRMERPGFDPYPQRDLGLSWLSMSRPMLEFVTRQGVGRQKNIELLGGCRVVEFLALPSGSAVSGVRYETSDGKANTIVADLVVDASGRGVMTLAALESMGFPKTEETEIGIDMAYSTAIFEQPVDAPPAWKGVIVLPAAPRDNRGAFLSPIENNRWIVSVGANHGDAPPGDMEGFLEFAKSLRTSTIYDAIKDAKPIGPIIRFLLPSSVRRRFETVQSFPNGLLPIGDAISRFNPVFGQGMSVAAQEAVILDRLLRARAAQTDPLDGLAAVFFAEIQGVLETPWGIATSDFIYPNTRGERPANFEQRMQFNLGLVRLGAQDPSIHKLMIEVNHLLKPQGALRAPEISERVAKLMATPA
ncbi:FAD-dependent monooxygenase [Bradyrhizobium sp. OAE829]|uniref:FAD-dependent monooxygenase n=1 Tax=Bradyrhizobium sp. OAE829 TaxID=2663807 RepID=UPI00178B0785